MTHTILTAEETQQIEDALESCNSGKWGMSFDEIDVERALAIIRAARAQEDTVCGFSLWLNRESWGHIVDGLMLERERSEQRKSANPESNSNYIADRCAELITQIGEAACVPMQPVNPGQPHQDDEAVDRFAAAMKAKLAKKRVDGRSGWDDKNRCSAVFLNELLNEHIAKGDPLDVGNLAMMLWSRGEPTTAKVTETSGVEWVTTFTPLRSGSENFLQIEDKCLAPKASVPEFTAEQKDRFARAFDAAFAKAGLPQKQPEKTNTQLMEGYRIGLAEMREKCARLCENRLDYYGVGSAHGLVIEKLAAAIRAIKFEGDTGFRPVSEMIAEEEPVNTRSTSEYSEPVKQSREEQGYVPLSNDAKSIFIDGFGEVPIDWDKYHGTAAPAQPVKQEPVPYEDSTPHLNVGDSSFEGWYQAHPKACSGDKQLARDAYAAGMGDPLVAPVQPVKHGSSPFKMIQHFVGREQHYNKALELACSYLTDEQVKEIADAMPSSTEQAEPCETVIGLREGLGVAMSPRHVPDQSCPADPWAMPIVRPEFQFTKAQREKIEAAFDAAIRKSPVLSAYYGLDQPQSGESA